MSAQPAAKRARAPALDAAVSTVAVPGLGQPRGLFVLADGTLLACAGHSISMLMSLGLASAPFHLCLEQHEQWQAGQAGC